MKRWLIVLLAFAISELFGSICVWHGTPTDWSGPPLRFWHYECGDLDVLVLSRQWSCIFVFSIGRAPILSTAASCSCNCSGG